MNDIYSLKIAIQKLYDDTQMLDIMSTIDTTKADIDRLQACLEDNTLWNDTQKAVSITQELQQKKDVYTLSNTVYNGSRTLLEMIQSACDDDYRVLYDEYYTLQNSYNTLYTLLKMSDVYDKNDSIISIYVGNGGQDAEDFTRMIYDMMLTYCSNKAYKTHILDEHYTVDGMKYSTFEATGMYSYGHLKALSGVHRLIRLSPFNSKNLRQTSFCRVEVIPKIAVESDSVIPDKDLRIDVFRASGPGGQGVNTTDSAVRITYLPLQIAVSCQVERSQIRNKERAMELLYAKIQAYKHMEQVSKIEDLKGDRLENSFGSQIITYTLQPYKLVKDHRTSYESSNPDSILAGNIDELITMYVMNHSL